MTYPAELQPLVDLGFALVPATAQKRPLVPWRQWTERLQTDDERADLPRGDLYAIVTGSIYDLVVLDFDMKIEGNGIRLGPETYAPNVRTPRGGAHLWFFAPRYPVKTVAGIDEGIDVRGEGGLIYVWGTTGKGQYRLETTHRYDPMPVAGLLPEKKAREADLSLAGTWDGEGAGLPSALRVLQRGCEQIRNAASGTSNSVTCRVAYSIGGLVGSGELDAMEAFNALVRAAGDRNVENYYAVIDHQMMEGAASPWRTCEPTEDGTDLWVPASDLDVAGDSAVREDLPVPPFPLHVLPDTIAQFAEQAARAAGAPLAYAAAPILPIMGAALGGLVQVVVPNLGWKERPCVWVALVGDPSSNKSPALRPLLIPVREAQRGMSEGDWHNVSPPQVIVNEPTIEGLFLVLERNERGVLLHSDELAGWVRSMGQYKGGVGNDRQHWLSIWGGEDTAINRATGQRLRYIKDPFVNVIGGVQPEVLEVLANDTEDGLAARLMLVPEGERPAKTLRITPVDETLTQKYTELWNAIRDAGTQAQTLPLTPKAFEVLADWYEEEWGPLSETAILKTAWGKLPAHVLRLALILAKMDDPKCEEVSADAMARGIELGLYFYRSTAALLANTEGATALEKRDRRRLEAVAEFLHANPGSTRRDIQRRWKWAQGRVLDDIVIELNRPDLRSSR